MANALMPHVSLDSSSFAGTLRATAVKQFGEYNTLVQKLRVLHQDQLQTVTSCTFTLSPLLNSTRSISMTCGRTREESTFKKTSQPDPTIFQQLAWIAYISQGVLDFRTLGAG